MDEGLNFSDIFDDDIPYEQKPPEMLTPMEESDSNELNGRSFWLDPKGIFHHVSTSGEWSHRDWARRFFDLPQNRHLKKHISEPSPHWDKSTAEFVYLKRNGYITVVKDVETIYFEYSITPNESQIKSLKSAAEKYNLKLYDDTKSKYIELPGGIEEDDYPIQTKNLFAGLWESDLLTETHLQDLYHATGEINLLKMLRDDAIKLTFAGGTAADEYYNKGYPYYLSTMRQKYGQFARGFGGPFGDDIPGHYDVIIHLNGEAVKNAGFKTRSMDYWAAGPERSEQEERILGNKDEMRPLAKFVKDIHVYIRKDLEHPKVIDALHKASELAPQRGIKIYFYPPGTKDYFRAHRTEKAVTDVSKILKPAVFTSDDLEYMALRKAHIEKYGDRKSEDLESFMRLYNGDYSEAEKYKSRDERVLRLLRYYPHDAYASLMADAHNYKKEHLPIFREIVAAMKKEGVKTFRDLITVMIDRERKRLEAQRELQEVAHVLKESEDLHFDVGNYNWKDRQAFCTFIIYPEFSVWIKSKENKSTFYSDSAALERELSEFNGKNVKAHGGIEWYVQHVMDRPGVNIPKRDYGQRGGLFSVARGRMWGIQGKLYISFWEPLKIVKPKWSEVEKIIHTVGYDPQKALYLFGGGDSEEYLETYNEIKQGIDKSKSIHDKDKMLRKLIHLSPEVKKAMIKADPNWIQSKADQLGISVVNLRQMLGSMDEMWS